MLRRALTDPLPCLSGRWAAAIVLVTALATFLAAWRASPLVTTDDVRATWERLLTLPARGGPLSFVEPLGLPGDDRLIHVQVGCTGVWAVLVPREQLERSLSLGLGLIAGEQVNPLAREAIARWSATPTEGQTARALVDRLVAVQDETRWELDRRDVSRLRTHYADLLRHHPVAAAIEAASFGAVALLLVAPWCRGSSALRWALHVSLAPALFLVPLGLGFRGDSGLENARGPYAAVARLGLSLYEPVEWPPRRQPPGKETSLRLRMRVLSELHDARGVPIQPSPWRLFRLCASVGAATLLASVAWRFGARPARGPLALEAVRLGLLVAPPSAASGLVLAIPALGAAMNGLAEGAPAVLVAAPRFVVWGSVTAAATVAGLAFRVTRPRHEGEAEAHSGE